MWTIACVQDAYLFHKRPRRLPSGAKLYSSSSFNCHIILYNPSLIHNQIFKSDHSIFINIKIWDQLITIGSQYTPPSADLQEDRNTIDAAFHKFSKSLLLFGDLNAHSPLWGYPHQDQKGTILLTLY